MPLPFVVVGLKRVSRRRPETSRRHDEGLSHSTDCGGVEEAGAGPEVAKVPKCPRILSIIAEREMDAIVALNVFSMYQS